MISFFYCCLSFCLSVFPSFLSFCRISFFFFLSFCLYLCPTFLTLNTLILRVVGGTRVYFVGVWEEERDGGLFYGVVEEREQGPISDFFKSCPTTTSRREYLSNPLCSRRYEICQESDYDNIDDDCIKFIMR